MVKRSLRLWAVLVLLLAVVWISGPRLDMSVSIVSPDLPESLDGYLRDSESRFSDITPGTEKVIVWAGEPDTRTEYALVYLHGFSATRQETAPLAERIGYALGANVFSTRFTGHGRGGEAMLDGSLNRWLNDTHEAMSIGRRLGDKVILMGVSTGATAAVWAALNDREQLAGLVLISPNFGPKDELTDVLTWPWGKQIARLLAGAERSWAPLNDAQARYWTTRYPTDAVLPMMAMVETVKQYELDRVTTPSLWIYSDQDQVVHVGKIRAAYREMGSSLKKRIVINDSEDPHHHVLAGDVLSPTTVSPVAQQIVRFVQAIPESKN